MAEGHLEFVLWDSTTECTDHLKCFQPVMYSHAVLVFWGANVYLSMADHDEYLALPNPNKAANVQDLIGRCFDGHSQVRPTRQRTGAVVHVRNCMCGNCVFIICWVRVSHTAVRVELGKDITACLPRFQSQLVSWLPDM